VGTANSSSVAKRFGISGMKHVQMPLYVTAKKWGIRTEEWNILPGNETSCGDMPHIAGIYRKYT